MNTMAIRATAAAVTGARHLCAARNGQDAAVAWTGSVGGTGPVGGEGVVVGRSGVAGGTSVVADAGVIVVCDGCSSGPSSEVGARLGASLFAGALTAQLQAGGRPGCAATWDAARTAVVRVLAELVERLPGDREQAVHDLLLFTVVAAAVTRDDAAVWVLGDGAYSFGEQTRVLGPFDDNQPPYLAYDLLGAAQPAHFEVAPATAKAIVIATDGAVELETGLERFATDRLATHPDALRRELAVLARTGERIDWDERRLVRTPAALQDDCAVGILRWSVV